MDESVYETKSIELLRHSLVPRAGENERKAESTLTSGRTAWRNCMYVSTLNCG